MKSMHPSSTTTTHVVDKGSATQLLHECCTPTLNAKPSAVSNTGVVHLSAPHCCASLPSLPGALELQNYQWSNDPSEGQDLILEKQNFSIITHNE